MEHPWGHSPPNGTLREAKLCFSKKTWFPARCEGDRERGRKGERFCGDLLTPNHSGAPGTCPALVSGSGLAKNAGRRPFAPPRLAQQCWLFASPVVAF